MNITVIFVIVLAGVFIIGGVFAGQMASKACEKADEMNKTQK